MDDLLLKGSAARLWHLIALRCERGADTASIDQRIWDLFGEEWAVVFTDLAGFSRRVEQFGIIHFLQVIYEHQKLLLPVVEQHDGILVKVEGDSMMLLFRRASRALDCLTAMMRVCEHVNVRRKPEEQILLCAGLGYGRILRVGDDDVWGSEVNAASKLGEDRAKAGEILITEAARAQLAVEGRVDLPLDEIEVEVPASPHNFKLRS
jgi:class 3 adenylate cyclase